MNKGKFSERKETEYPGQLHFHYNREERLTNLSPDVVNRDTKKRRLFRNNRPLVILFLDVLFVLVLYFIISPVLQRYASRTDLSGYELQLRAFLFEESTFLSVKIEAEEPPSSTVQNLVTIRFSLEGREESEEIMDVLPDSPGESMIYRARLQGGEGRQKAYAEVIIGEESERLKTEILPEQD